MTPRTFCWLLLFILFSALALRTHILLRSDDSETLYREQAAYGHLRTLIRERYVKVLEIEDNKKLFYGAMTGMTDSLDKHSHFFSPESYKQFQDDTSGQMEGVGMKLGIHNTHGLLVLTPMRNSPAWAGGVQQGDRILKINGESTEKMKIEAAVSQIKGVGGTKVTLTLLHEGESTPVNVTLNRDAVDIPSVPVAELLGKEWVTEIQPKIGFVEVSGFKKNTADDIEKALKKLESQGMAGLILDLRQNPGGLLNSAEKICDMFLHDGPIVSVTGRAEKDSLPITQTTLATEAGTHPDYPIVVLIDSGSASASEIVAGCLKDRGRAVLVGDRSYGKFSVQEVIPFNLGNWGKAGLKLTTARYKTPLDACIDLQGIVPDYLVPSSTEQQQALQQHRFQREINENNPRSDRPPLSLAEFRLDQTEADPKNNATPKKTAEPFVDSQLKKAVEILLLKIKN